MSLSRRALLIAAAGATALTALPALAADTSIDVSLWDDQDKDMAMGLGYGMGGDMSKANMGIRLSRSTVPAGTVTFNVSNDSEVMEHEMVVSSIVTPGAPLPYDSDEDGLKEEEYGTLGEVSELEPGKKGGLRLDMAPGQYILFCNVPGHYMGGMWTVLTVE